MKFSIEAKLGNLFGGFVLYLIGCAIYEKGRADAVHQIYEKGYKVVQEDETK